jgi:hypothetical protein
MRSRGIILRCRATFESYSDAHVDGVRAPRGIWCGRIVRPCGIREWFEAHVEKASAIKSTQWNRASSEPLSSGPFDTDGDRSVATLPGDDGHLDTPGASTGRKVTFGVRQTRRRRAPMSHTIATLAT